MENKKQEYCISAYKFADNQKLINESSYIPALSIVGHNMARIFVCRQFSPSWHGYEVEEGGIDLDFFSNHDITLYPRANEHIIRAYLSKMFTDIDVDSRDDFIVADIILYVDSKCRQCLEFSSDGYEFKFQFFHDNYISFRSSSL